MKSHFLGANMLEAFCLSMAPMDTLVKPGALPCRDWPILETDDIK